MYGFLAPDGTKNSGRRTASRNKSAHEDIGIDHQSRYGRPSGIVHFRRFVLTAFTALATSNSTSVAEVRRLAPCTSAIDFQGSTALKARRTINACAKIPLIEVPLSKASLATSA
jgi:hypothetical protein